MLVKYIFSYFFEKTLEIAVAMLYNIIVINRVRFNNFYETDTIIKIFSNIFSYKTSL